MLEKLMRAGYTIVYAGYFDYNHKGYFFGRGRANSGDAYYYVDGKMLTIALQVR